MKDILIVDDYLEFRRMLSRLLESAGYRVREAENGAEALQMHRSAPADLIITDILMPEKEGLETIRELRREYPDIKIIAMSGGGQAGTGTYLNLAEKLGASRTFIKPFEVLDLLEAVKELTA